jgi:magnesium chelatase subunit ChlD-like protein
VRIHWLRTLAAKQQQPLQREHLRRQTQQARAGALHCFLLDCSGSMLGGQQLARVKGALLQLIQRAYQRREQVAIVSFAGAAAQVRIAPSTALPLASLRLQQWLQPIGGGGGTPLLHGAATAAMLLRRAAKLQPAQQRWLWLFTDGRSADLPPAPTAADVLTVVDCERQRVALGRCRQLAQHWRADYCALDHLLIQEQAIP